MRAWQILLVLVLTAAAMTTAIFQYRDCRKYGMSILLCSRYLVR